MTDELVQHSNTVAAAGGPVLVCGATGFIGSDFVRALDDRGIPVIALSRSGPSVERRFPDRRIEARTGDVTRPDSLAGAFRGVHTVIQTVQFSGFPVESPARGRTFMEVDAFGTRNVVDAAATAGVERLIYISGVGADPSSARSWFKAKAIAEEAVTSAPLTHVIVRPSWVFGPGDRSLNLFVRILRLNPLFFPQIGDGRQRLNPLFIGDLTRTVVDVVASGTGHGETFEIGGPAVQSLDEILRVVMKVTGAKRPILHIPSDLAKLVGSAAELLPGQLLSAEAIDFLTQGAVADNTRFLELFGRDTTPLEPALRTYLTT